MPTNSQPTSSVPRATSSITKPLRSILVGVLLAIGTSLVLLLVLLVYGLTSSIAHSYARFNSLRQTAQLSWGDIVQVSQTLLLSKTSNTPITFLVLGTDELATRGNQTPLTDTIMIVKFVPASHSIKLLPIPRDVWLTENGSKVNAVYAQVSQRDDADTTQVTQAFSNLLKQHIDATLVVSMDVVRQLIDAVGGVDVEVQTAFIDYQFPRTDVDVTVVKDPAKLYETVQFEAGSTHLDGQTALKYMRSRHSLGSEGNDLARSKRQQQVIDALIQKIVLAAKEQQLDVLANILAVYQTTLGATQLPLPEAAKLLSSLPNDAYNYSMIPLAIPLVESSSSGVLYHPTTHYSGQWVFVPTSIDAFQQSVAGLLQ